MAKLRVGIVFGGKSAEHEVSLQSAKNIVDALDKENFEPVLLGMDKHGRWQHSDARDWLLNANDPAHIALKPSEQRVALIPGEDAPALLETTSGNALGVDVIFPIVHGTLGEDGSLQGMLRMANLPFVGSGVLGSAVSMDKDVAKRLLRDAGLNVAPFITLKAANRDSVSFTELEQRFGLPLFVKPASQGSSVGVSRVNSESEYRDALKLALRFDNKVLVEKGITGREIECAVLGNENPEASTCGEIVVNATFYSYDAKYISDAQARVVVPAELPAALNDEIRATAIRAFQALECCGMARVDVFLTPENEVVINEINTLPGFTNISMYPKLWQASGLGYSALITRLIELAIARHREENALESSLSA
ncbi:D-alanine--D-alanine ligase [Enterobacteriaceae bacterium 4M9]|nr:D-alanine--D-alanine ligase [Enterobacteriaceae bacterium 4M9]